MPRRVDADYLVIGAGATGMAFADAIIDHSTARVAIVERRHGVGGHWLDAYPFVRLHQSSQFYGVASTVLGGGRVQVRGPEAGLHERADQPTICAYYADVLADRLLASDRVELYSGCDYLGDQTFASRVSGETYRVADRCRIVDATYLAPDIPATMPPRFTVEDGARVVAVNDLVRVEEPPDRYVVVGSGKTATDAIVWLLDHGVEPDAICWVRPREPWMLNRAVVQPDPAVFLGMAAEVMAAASGAATLDEVFLRLEEAGVMLRIDRAATPTMAKAPTLGTWELDLLRTVEDVVRRGHLTAVAPGLLQFRDGSVAVGRDALVVNCAADGLKNPPLVPVWRPEAITLQPIRSGFPCFGAALVGFVEATRGDDATKNQLCSPSNYGNTLQDWARMTAVGTRNAAAFGAAADVREWASGVALNPARIPAGQPSPALDDALDRLARHTPTGVARLAQLAGGDGPPPHG